MDKIIGSTAYNIRKVLLPMVVALVVIAWSIGGLGCGSDPVSLSAHFTYSEEELKPLRSSSLAERL